MSPLEVAELGREGLSWYLSCLVTPKALPLFLNLSKNTTLLFYWPYLRTYLFLPIMLLLVYKLASISLPSLNPLYAIVKGLYQNK